MLPRWNNDGFTKLWLMLASCKEITYAFQHEQLAGGLEGTESLTEEKLIREHCID
jgi:hypothetical protein